MSEILGDAGHAIFIIATYELVRWILRKVSKK